MKWYKGKATLEDITTDAKCTFDKWVGMGENATHLEMSLIDATHLEMILSRILNKSHRNRNYSENIVFMNGVNLNATFDFCFFVAIAFKVFS